MQIKKLPIGKVHPAKYNPREDLKADDPDYIRIKGAIDEFGPVVPLVWNERNGNLVGGHQRLKIYKKKGYTEVEVSVVNLDETQEEALNIALNNAHGRNDNRKLHTLLAKIKEEDPERLPATGFDEERMAALIETSSGDDDSGGTRDDPDPNAKTIIQITCPREITDEIVQAMTSYTDRPGVRLQIL